jgi:DAK2 domain fusion protein YloV
MEQRPNPPASGSQAETASTSANQNGQPSPMLAPAVTLMALPAVNTLDGVALRTLFVGAYEWLAAHVELVNRLNVFPVPDGDTGTNLLLTLKAACQATEGLATLTCATVTKAMADGALRGSRGNSGVIMSQFLLGMSRSLVQRETLTSESLAAALANGATVAYSSVPTPVEGTILTVMRVVGEMAQAIAATAPDLVAFLAQLVDRAEAAVLETPNLLPVLKKANVVDSGGKGFALLLAGMYRTLSGVDQPVHVELPTPNATTSATLAKGERPLPPVKWGFDVQFLIEQPNQPLSAIQQAIAAMGEYPLVEGDERLVKVHVHVLDPGQPLTYGVQVGFVTDVVVENLDDMATSAHPGDEPPQVVETPAPAEPMPEAQPALRDEIGFVAVAPGDGFATLFQTLGVGSVVVGGQTMNPSTEELLAAIERLPHRRVLILPNNSNVILAAQQAAALAAESGQREVLVVPTKTVPQGITALLACDPADELSRALAQMQEQIAQIDTGEVTQAVRSAEFDGVTVEIGDFIGLHDGRLVTRGSTAEEVVLSLLEQMAADESGLITLYSGEFIATEAAENLKETVRNRYPDQEVALVYGGQPHYHYILSTE